MLILIGKWFLVVSNCVGVVCLCVVVCFVYD